MQLDALVHITGAVAAMAESERIIVFGSASLLGSFPELGEAEQSPLRLTYDADLIPFPFEEEVGMMLDEAFGEERVFHQRFGYHADIVRPAVAETFPSGWADRLVALSKLPDVYCLDPHDMAAAKCLLGRGKDRVQLEFLLKNGYLDWDKLKERLTLVAMQEKAIVRSHRFLDSLK